MVSRRIVKFAITIFAVLTAVLLPHSGFSQQPTAPDNVFQRVHTAGTVRESRALLLEELLPSLEDAVEIQRAHALIAELAELSSDYAAAQLHYRRAWDVRPDRAALGLLLLSAQLRLELGDLNAALSEAKNVLELSDQPPQRLDSRLLIGRILLASGNRPAAISTVESVWQSIEDRPGVNSDSGQLFVTYDLARQLELEQVAQGAFTALGEHHSRSVEYSLARSDRPSHQRRVEPFPSPTQIFAALPYTTPPPAAKHAPPETGTAAAARTATAATATRKVHGIQTGTFRDPENATYMARDISNAGFPVEVHERTRDGVKSYQVVVPLERGTEREQALSRMTALKDAGIEGFLLYE